MSNTSIITTPRGNIQDAINRLGSTVRFMNSVSSTILEAINEAFAKVGDERNARSQVQGYDHPQVEQLSDVMMELVQARRAIADQYDAITDKLDDARLALRTVACVDKLKRDQVNDDPEQGELQFKVVRLAPRDPRNDVRGFLRPVR